MAQRSQRLAEVLTTSETLHERLARFFVPGAAARVAEPPPAKAKANLAAWAKAAANGDVDQLIARLAWDGVTPGQAAAAWIGDDSVPSVDAPWIHLLGRATESTEPGDDDPTVDRRTAFAPLWAPWRRAAFERLDAVDPDWRRPLSDAALRALRRELDGDLCELGSLAAYERFDAIRTAARIAGGSGASGDSNGDGTELYDAFTLAVLTRPLDAFYNHYPVLARQLAEHAVRWGDALLELLRRLGADWPGLRRRFDLGRPAPRILGFGRSSREDGEAPAEAHADAHQGGRRVRRLILDAGDGEPRAVIYKPRDVSAEVILERCFTWAAARGLADAPGAPRGLDGGGYGYFEAIDAGADFAAAADAAAYFRRAGALVAFADALRGRDLHAENIVATPSGPVAVDGEMFFQPRRATRTTGGDPSEDRAAGSCLDSGLFHQPTADDDGRELGGLRPCRLRPGLGVGHRFR
ncbi:MAG: DUF4135 domain-containing protein, partial [Acidobacteriota bacterium]